MPEGNYKIINKDTNGNLILESGNLGIGKIAPQYDLDVVGNINFSGSLYNNGTVFTGVTKGMIVQLEHTDYKEKVIKSGTGWVPIDNRTDGNGFIVKITPNSVNSKVLVNTVVHIGVDTAVDARWWGIRLYRKIGTGSWNEVTDARGENDTTTYPTGTGHQGQPVWFANNQGIVSSISTGNDAMLISNSSASFLDSPNTTDEVIYTLYWASRIGDGATSSATIYLNRSHSHGDFFRPTPQSSLTATEIWNDGTPYTPSPTDSVITVDTINSNVGIGTSNPTSKLHIETPDSLGTTTQVLNFKNDSDYGIYAESTSISGRGNTLNFKSRDYNANNNDIRDVLTMRPEGYVGIGKTDPDSPLTINGFSEFATSSLGGYAYIGGPNPPFSAIPNPSGSVGKIGVHVQWNVKAYIYLLASDTRIKKEFEEVSDNEALDIINKIEIVKYHYKDPDKRNELKTIGFKAQQVKEILPNAVKITNDFIPDILELIENPVWEDNKLIYNVNLSGDEYTGKVKFYIIENEKEEEKILEYNEGGFVFKKQYDKVFVFGKEVNDFHNLDKKTIYAVGMSAIQELSRLNDTKTQEITELKTENKELKEKLQTMESDMALVKQKLGL